MWLDTDIGLIIIGIVLTLFLPRKSISKIVDETVENYLDSWKFQEIMAAALKLVDFADRD